jgi:hypothetical protein
MTSDTGAAFDFSRLRRSPAAAPTLIFVLAMLLLAPALSLGLNLYDDGLRLYGATEVLAGRQPYHDFFAYYGPAQYYWLALLFAVFGAKILVARVAAGLVAAAAATAAFVLVRRAGFGSVWALLPALAVIVPLTLGEYFYTCDPAFLLVLLAGVVIVSGDATPKRGALAGACLGLASMFRIDFAAYGGVAALAALAANALGAPDVALAQRRRSALRSCLILFGAAAVVALPVFLGLALRGLRREIECLIWWPQHLMPLRRLPYGFALHKLLRALPLAPSWPMILSGSRLLVALTPLLAALSAPLLAASRVRALILGERSRRTIFVFCAVAALTFSVYGFGRASAVQLYPLHVLSCCLVALLWAAGVHGLAEPVQAKIAPILATLLALVALLSLGARFSERSAYFPEPTSGLRVPTWMMWLPRAVKAVTKYAGGRPILVASERHDRVDINAATLYFLAKTPSATYFFDYLPGLTTTEAVQARIVEDLRRSQSRAIVVWKHVFRDEPNPSRLSSGVNLLDGFIADEFMVVEDTPQYRVLARR